MYSTSTKRLQTYRPRADMAPVDILKFPISSPADTSPLDDLKRMGYDASQILGVVGKTEGNGCVNDFSRTLSAIVWEPLIPESAVTIFSGGTEGVLSPHLTFIMREAEHSGLLASVGRTRALEPHEIGSVEHARQVSKTVTAMIKELEVPLDLVKLVLVKCPLLTSTKLERIKASGKTPITSDTYESMAKSRHASAIGIAVALEEISGEDLEAKIASQQSWSAKASCSSGGELENCQILLLANSPTIGPLRALSGYMKDAIDLRAITDLLGQVQAEGGKVVQIFAKAEADPTGLIRGRRHTMNTDSDIHGTRHARAAVGGLIAGATGDTEVYVSGGAEGQGPIGGGSLCIIYRHE